jgi:predicted hydrocarbon binding protein
MKPITPPKLPLVHQRAIEARMAAAMIEGYAEAIGHRPALDIAGRVIRHLARETGRALAAERGSNTLDDLAELIFRIWCAEDALTIEILEQSPSRLYFNVVRCGYAEQYEQMGLKDYGFCLSCNRDGAFSEGFNPGIRLTRTQTIMEGAPFCDFRFKRIPPIA